jgi:hypothetical protein
VPSWPANGPSSDPRFNSYIPRLLEDISKRFGVTAQETAPAAKAKKKKKA